MLNYFSLLFASSSFFLAPELLLNTLPGGAFRFGTG